MSAGLDSHGIFNIDSKEELCPDTSSLRSSQLPSTRFQRREYHSRRLTLFEIMDKGDGVHNEAASESSEPTSFALMNLTFGVEIECVVAYPADIFCFGRSRKDAKMKREIEEFLMANNIPTNELRGDDPITYDMWTVNEDATIKKPNDTETEGYDDIEIQSRILAYEDASFDEVRKVLCLANDNLKLLVNTEYTCGLHVHIGNQDQGFPLTVLKRYALLVTAFEHLLIQLVPAHRFDTSKGFKCYCIPPSRLSTFQGLSLPERLDKLRACEVEWQLSETMSPIWTGKNAAFNLGSHGDKTKRTIEHRMFAGTTNAEEIIAYVELCAGLVEFAWNSSDDSLESILILASDDAFGLEQLLLAINRHHLMGIPDGKLAKGKQSGWPSVPTRTACLKSVDEVPSLENSPASGRSRASTSAGTEVEDPREERGENANEWMADEMKLDFAVLSLNDWREELSLNEQNVVEECQIGWSEMDMRPRVQKNFWFS